MHIIFEAELLTLKMKSTTKNIFVLICVFAIFAVAHGKAESIRLKRSSQTCGVSKLNFGLIVKEQSFSRGSFPWIVALMYTATEPASFFCGGTLISTTFVVSGEELKGHRV